MVVMTTRVRVVVVVSVLALTASLLTLALMAKSAEAQAETITTNERFQQGPVAIQNPCTGEEVIFEGRQHIVMHQTAREDGGFLIVFHNNFQGHGVSASGAFP
jgi:hypothetical protein